MGAVSPAPYAALRAVCEALLPPSAPPDVCAWGAGVLSTLTALVGGTRARFVLRIEGHAYTWGDAPELGRATWPATSAPPAWADGGTVGVAVATADAAGEAEFVCALCPDERGRGNDVHTADAVALLGAVCPMLTCALALRARGGAAGAAAAAGVVPAPVVPAAGPAWSEAGAADWLRDHFGLTCRELDVARLLVVGQRNREIARALGISPHTARHHTEHVLVKLGVDSRAAVPGLVARPTRSCR